MRWDLRNDIVSIRTVIFRGFFIRHMGVTHNTYRHASIYTCVCIHGLVCMMTRMRISIDASMYFCQ